MEQVKFKIPDPNGSVEPDLTKSNLLVEYNEFKSKQFDAKKPYNPNLIKSEKYIQTKLNPIG